MVTKEAAASLEGSSERNGVMAVYRGGGRNGDGRTASVAWGGRYVARWQYRAGTRRQA